MVGKKRTLPTLRLISERRVGRSEAETHHSILNKKVGFVPLPTLRLLEILIQTKKSFNPDSDKKEGKKEKREKKVKVN